MDQWIPDVAGTLGDIEAEAVIGCPNPTVPTLMPCFYLLGMILEFHLGCAPTVNAKIGMTSYKAPHSGPYTSDATALKRPDLATARHICYT